MEQKAFADQLFLWSKGIAYELRFWRNWAESRGGRYATDFERRMSGTQPFEAGLANLFPAGQPIDVLDVGAGPISPLGIVCDRNPLRITATDPLADAYRDILDDCGLVPPIRTDFATAEDLSAFFPRDRFDLVHCRNALDHSLDPMRGIEEMLTVCRPGGFVLLRHHVNEGQREGYSGFHQHNFDEAEGRFVIWNNESRLDVTAAFAGRATVETKVNPDRSWIEVMLRKPVATGAAGSAGEDALAEAYRARVRVLIRDTFGFMVQSFGGAG